MARYLLGVPSATHLIAPAQMRLQSMRRELKAMQGKLEAAIAEHERAGTRLKGSAQVALIQTTSTNKLTTFLGTTGQKTDLDSIPKIEKRMDELASMLEKPHMGKGGKIACGILGIAAGIAAIISTFESLSFEPRTMIIVPSLVVIVGSIPLGIGIWISEKRQMIKKCYDETQDTLTNRFVEFKGMIEEELGKVREVLKGARVA